MIRLRGGFGGPVARAGRLAAGVALGWSVALAVAAPEVPPVCQAAALLTLLLTLWRPDLGLLALALLAPAGLLLAPAPVRATEILAWALLAGWLLRVWRPLAERGWPASVARPAILFAVAALASWLTITIAGASGIAPASLPRFVLRSVRPDHLLFSSPEPQTWTLLQSLTGVGVFMAALASTAHRPRAVRWVAAALVVSLAGLSMATLVSIESQWAGHEYAGWFLWQYATSERFAFHLTDVNAAGSQYVLAALIAVGLAVFDRPRRWIWIVLLAVLLLGMWLTGSRSAGLVGAAVGGLMLPAAAGYRWKPGRAALAGIAVAVLIGVVGGAVILTRGMHEKGSAGRAVRLRVEFSETSGRMIRSAPIYGVGIGRYHARSNEFMPAELRALYAYENAHNYFAQQFAELGLIGGAIFLWLVAAPVRLGWSSLRHADRAAAGLFAGSIAYLVTCLTGHPLLVSEAAVPFWMAFGALAGAAAPAAKTAAAQGISPSWRTWHRPLAAALALVLAAPVVLAALSYTQPAMPGVQGFDDFERAPDGTRFQWTTRHAVSYVPAGNGFLRMTLRAPDGPHLHPYVVETEVDGLRIDRRALPPGQWVTAEIPVRPRRPGPYQRVDLRVNQAWTRPQALGRRLTHEPLGVMVAEIRWLPGRP